VVLKQLDFFPLSIRESHSLNEGEVSTEEKFTIVSSTCVLLFFKNGSLSQEVIKRNNSKKKETRKNIVLFKP
jgi:hypothetical protein